MSTNKETCINVSAIDLDSPSITNFDQLKQQISYSLEVEPGEYYVFYDKQGYGRSYYSAFNQCAAKYNEFRTECYQLSGDKLKLTATPNQTLNNINVGAEKI